MRKKLIGFTTVILMLSSFSVFALDGEALGECSSNALIKQLENEIPAILKRSRALLNEKSLNVIDYKLDILKNNAKTCTELAKTSKAYIVKIDVSLRQLEADL